MEFGGAEYGRDQKKINELVNQMENKVNLILKKITTDSAEFKAIETALKNCWVGVDADNFLTALKNKNKEVYANVKATKNKFTSYFKNDEEAFAKFQETNKLI